MLNIVGSAIFYRGIVSRVHPLPVFGMNHVDKSVHAGAEHGRVDFKHATGFIRPVQHATYQVELPTSDLADALRIFQGQPAALQFVFHAAAGGDVLRCTDEAYRIALRIVLRLAPFEYVLDPSIQEQQAMLDLVEARVKEWFAKSP